MADDTPGVIAELRRLRNTRYHDHPVSLYGGMVELPLIVTRDDGARWFADRNLLTSDRLWAERDAELRADTQRLARDLPDNLFGREVWASFEPGTRSFLASGEATFRARRDDPTYDFSGPAMEYAKAVETELNATLFPGLRRVLQGKPPKDREVRWEGRPLDLAGPVPHQTLGAMAHLLEHDDVVKRALGAAFNANDAGWLRGLPLELKGVIDARNEAAHAGAVGVELALTVRARVLGIGVEGLLVRLVGVKRRGK